MKPSLLAAVLIAVALGGILGATGRARAEISPMDTEGPAWRRLEYEAGKLGFRIEASVELSSISDAELERALIAAGDADALEADDRGGLLLEIDSTGLGRRSLVEFWFRPDGTALQRLQIETGDKSKHNRFKINRFAADGVFSLIRRPAGEETSRPHEDWSERSEDYETFPAFALAHGPISEPSALFYLASVAPLNAPSDTVSVPVLSKGRVVLVTLSVLGPATIKVRYGEDSGAGLRQVVGRREVLAIGLESRPLGPEAGDGAFRFMGLGGDIVLYVDPVRRIPVQLSGSVKYAGRSHLKLRRVVLE